MKLKKKVGFTARAPHHMYLGAMIMFLGWTMQDLPMYGYWDSVFLVGGALIMADDIMEHTLTGSTPLRWFFIKVICPFLDWTKGR